MMHSIKKMALVTGIFSLGYFAFQLFAQQAPGGGGNTCSTTLQDVTNTDGSHSFSLSCLPSLNNNQISRDTAFWRVFFSLGDGRFWMGTYNDFKAKQFYLNTVTDGHTPFVDYHAAYDDTDDPHPHKMTIRNDSLGMTPEITSVDPLYLRIQNGFNRLVKIQSTSSPIPGQNLIYLITYQGTSTNAYSTAGNLSIEFRFNSDILKYRSYEVFGNETVAYTTSQNTGLLTINVPNKLGDNNQRTVLLFFKVDPSAVVTGSPMNPAPTVKYYAKQTGSSSLLDEDNSLSAQALTYTSDPSFKFNSDSDWHYSDTLKQFYTDYEILIQNDGTKRIDKITVEDILDPLFDSISFTPTAVNKPQPGNINPMAGKFPPKLDPIPAKNHRHHCYIDFINLRGLREPDFGRTFTETETKTKLFMRCYVKKGKNPLDSFLCNAVCNQANVYFDCNPKHKTNLAIKSIPCKNGNACVVTSDSVVLQNLPNNGQQILPGNIAQNIQNEGYNIFKWYPGIGLSDPFALNPAYFLADQESYTLVASSPNCKQKIFKVKLPLCKLGFELKEVCDRGALYLQATAKNFSGNGQQLKWNNCQYGTSIKFQIYPNTSQYYYLGVSDTTGCSAETTYYFTSSASCGASDFWEIVILSVIGTVIVFMAAAVVINALSKSNTPTGE